MDNYEELTFDLPVEHSTDGPLLSDEQWAQLMKPEEDGTTIHTDNVGDFMRWVHPDPLALINVAYKPRDATKGGKPVALDGRTVEGVEAAQRAVEACMGVNPLSVYCTVHKGAATAWGAKWNKGVVARYQFLAIDLDNKPAVKGRVCATDTERERIEVQAEKIKEGLSMSGLPAPAMIFTGNGYLLMFPIDLEANDENHRLLGRLAKALAATYDTGFCAVDTDVVIDPSRILGVVGTVNNNKAEVPEQGRFAKVRAVVGEYPDRTPMPESDFMVWAESYIREHEALAAVVDEETTSNVVTGLSAHADKPVTAAVGLNIDGGTARARLHEAAAFYLAKCAAESPAIEGDGGDTQTMRIAGHLASLRYTHADGPRLSEDEALALMLAHYNPHCVPPWDEAELKVKVESGFKRGTPRPVKIVEDRTDTAGLTEWASSTGDVVDDPDDDDGGVVMLDMDKVVRKPVRWLWENRIAAGKLTVMGGDPGTGKSFISIDIAARVSTGAPFPDEDFPSNNNLTYRAPRRPGKVILLSAEDDPADTIGPRLDAHGADCRNVKVLTAVKAVTKDGKAVERGITLADVDKLDKAIRIQNRTAPGVQLVVIDPVGSFVGKADSYNDAEVRTLLTPLKAMAERHDVAVLLVMHLNKSAKGGLKALYRFMGSQAFAGMARTAHMVTRKDGDDMRYFLPVKNNVGNDRIGMRYQLVQTIDGMRIEWDKRPVDESADDVLGAVSEKDNPRTDEAREFITDLLASGPVSAKEVEADAKGAGITARTLRRAREALGIKPYRYGGVGTRGEWLWALSEDHGKPVRHDGGF